MSGPQPQSLQQASRHRERKACYWCRTKSIVAFLASRSLAMATALHPPAIKLVGSNGQISLGKQYAGRHVLVEEPEPGVWIVRTATVIPDNERWLHEPAAAAALQAALVWSASHPPADAHLDETLTRLGFDQA